MTPTTIASDTKTIRGQYQSLKASEPKLRIRDAATKMGVSEARLVATGVGENVIRLRGSWENLLRRLPALGHVMALTRNEHCVMEHKGCFKKVNVMPHVATVMGPIEARVFHNEWYFGFAVEDTKADGRKLTSLQFFDREGTAITKIYLQPDSIREAYEALVKDFRAEEQSPEVAVQPYPKVEYAPTIDKTAFRNAWLALKDTHQFHGLLKKFNVSRYDALVYAGEGLARRVKPDGLKALLKNAAHEQLPIMIFVGNRGNIQIHQDVVERIVEIEDWLNVMDADFNLHLRIKDVDEVWVVRKPTKDGIVTSVELFDAGKELITRIFGLRKPGKPELKNWQALVDRLQPA